MKQKTIALLIGALTAGSLFGETTISEVIVRQQWPWKATVNVDFTIAGSTGEVAAVVMNAYAGDTFLGQIPPSACTGHTTVFGNGLKRITFNPADVAFLSTNAVISNFRLDVAAQSVAPEEILYMIFDLRKIPGEEGQVDYVTESALTNGAWGSWERAQWGLVDTPIWTGVNEDDKYKTTHLVVRRIPAGSFTYGTSPDSNLWREAADITNTTVTITKPYYVGVFEFTKAQYQLTQDRTKDPATIESPLLPDTYRYYATKEKSSSLRGHPEIATYPNYDWPNGKSIRGGTILSVLAERTGRAFDLPTEAQWEKAARGGSTGVYYSSNGQSSSQKSLNVLAKWNGQSARSNVGTKEPNDYGLYDTLGNVGEIVLDWYQASYVPAATDPEGPTSSTDNKRVVKGGTYRDEIESVYLGYRIGAAHDGAKVWHGYRVCCPAQ